MGKKKVTKTTNKKANRSSGTVKSSADDRTGAEDSAASNPADRSSAAAEQTQALPRTRLTPEELAEFRRLLLAKRAELVGDVSHMTDQALRDSQPGGTGSLSNVPIHMADVGSDNWEQEFTLDLVDTERQLLKEIDAALERIGLQTYGICEATHKPIKKQRLRAKPWAQFCIEYARERELGRQP